MNVLFVLSTQIKLPSKLFLANTLIMIRYSDPMPTHLSSNSEINMFIVDLTVPLLVGCCRWNHSENSHAAISGYRSDGLN